VGSALAPLFARSASDALFLIAVFKALSDGSCRSSTSSLRHVKRVPGLNRSNKSRP
jgi:hypothetical protein